MRSFRGEKQSQTPSVLFTVDNGFEESVERRIPSELEQQGHSLSSSTDSPTNEMFTKDNSGEGQGGGDSTPLARTSLVPDVAVDDSEDDSVGEFPVVLAPWLQNAKIPGSPSAGNDGGVFSGRINDQGMNLIIDLFQTWIF
jgi:hypothetical protein